MYLTVYRWFIWALRILSVICLINLNIVAITFSTFRASLFEMSLSQGEELVGIKSLVAALTFVLLFSLLILVSISLLIVLPRSGITRMLCIFMLGQGDVVHYDLLNGWLNWCLLFLDQRASLSSNWSIFVSHLLFLVSIDNLSLLSKTSIIHKMVSNHLSLFCRSYGLLISMLISVTTSLCTFQVFFLDNALIQIHLFLLVFF